MFSSKTLRAALGIALTLAWSLAPAYADLLTTHAGRASGPTSIPISNACIASSGTTITFTAQGVGNASVSRLTVVSINWGDSTAAGTAELTGMTVAGITMTRAVRAAGDNQNSNSEVWFAVNPTGTTANIVATFSTAVDAVTIEVYRLVGYNTVIATTTGTTSATQGYNNKQLAIAAASRRVNVSTSLSNMVNDFSSACGASLWGVHASQRLSGNNGTLTTTISPNTNTPLIAMVVWGVAVSCPESVAFLTRASGASLDFIHTAAYQTLICSIAATTVWAKLDIFYILATQNTTAALLNLKSSSFNLTANGSPTFTADRGYTGVDGSTTVYLQTGFNPSTAGGNYTLNSAHLSVFQTINLGSDHAQFGESSGSLDRAHIVTQTTGGDTLMAVNQQLGTAIFQHFNVGGGIGHWVASRNNSASTMGGYWGGSLIVSGGANTVIPNNNMVILAATQAAGGVDGSSARIGSASAGAGFSSSEVLSFSTAVTNYMTAVGAPTTP